MSAQRWASAIHINAGTRVESRICVIVANRVIVAKRARRSSPQRVIGVAKELAHGDIAVGLCAAEAACAQRVGEGAGAEARGRRGNAEAGHFQCPALAFEQVARRREGRVLIRGRSARGAGYSDTVNHGRPANQVGRSRPLQSVAHRPGVRLGGICVAATDQRDQIVGVVAAGTKSEHGSRGGVNRA